MNQNLKDHLKESIQNDVRVDGRTKHEHRDIKIEKGTISTAEGSARLLAGDAEILAGVKAEVREPWPDTPDAGSLRVNLELLALSSPDFESGRPGIESIEPSRVIDRGFRESGAIDLKNLCIKKGEKVYGLSIDIVPLNYDGNIYGLGGLAALAALQDTKLPGLTDTGSIDYDSEGPEFNIEKTPVPITVYKVGDLLLIDPTDEEENIADARLTITTLKDNKVCSLQKGGTAPITEQDFEDMLDLAFKTREKLLEALHG